MTIENMYGPLTHDLGKPGLVAKAGTPHVLVSCVAQEEIPFGIAVTYGDQDGTCKPCKTSADAVAGIAVCSIFDGVEFGDGTKASYPTNTSIPVLKAGFIYVAAHNAVTAGTPAFLFDGGKIGGEAQGGIALKDVRFESSAAAGGLALLYIS